MWEKSEAELPSDYPTPLVQLQNIIAAYTYLPAYLINTLRTGIFFLYIYHRSLNRSEDTFL
jgi:hypothetical protein